MTPVGWAERTNNSKGNPPGELLHLVSAGGLVPTAEGLLIDEPDWRHDPQEIHGARSCCWLVRVVVVMVVGAYGFEFGRGAASVSGFAARGFELDGGVGDVEAVA